MKDGSAPGPVTGLQKYASSSHRERAERTVLQSVLRMLARMVPRRERRS